MLRNKSKVIFNFENNIRGISLVLSIKRTRD